MKSEKQLYQWDVNQFLTELQPEVLQEQVMAVMTSKEDD